MPSPKRYRINEIFYSLQGEGIRAGTPNLFLRFSGCNLTCSKAKEGFDCDTEFTSGRSFSAKQIMGALEEAGKCDWLILTGGEPTLQLDEELILSLTTKYKLAIETNGTAEIPRSIRWVTVSPKTAEHTLKQLRADEVKYVRRYGQALPSTRVHADHYLISPAFGPDGIDPKDLRWCVDMVKENPEWRLSCQQHKWWGIR